MTIITTINDYFYVSSLFVIGSLGAFAFTSYCIVNKDYKHLLQKVNDDDNKREEVEHKRLDEVEANSYENKYNLEKAIHNKDHCDLGEKYIFDATPDGVIILNYDSEIKSFNYWSDHTIQYKYLQTAARRFVYDYHCKDYYIQCDEKDKKNHAKPNKTDTCVKDPWCVCDSDKCKLPTQKPVNGALRESIDRDYKEAETDMKKLRTTDSRPNDTKKNEDDNLFVKTKKSGQKTITMVANKYSHRGCLIDFYISPSKRKTGKDISFTDFMKQNRE